MLDSVPSTGAAPAAGFPGARQSGQRVLGLDVARRVRKLGARQSGQRVLVSDVARRVRKLGSAKRQGRPRREEVMPRGRALGLGQKGAPRRLGASGLTRTLCDAYAAPPRTVCKLTNDGLVFRDGFAKLQQQAESTF